MDPIASTAPESAENEPIEHLIVGIGASAGGLEALEQFFEAAPVDKDFTYVVVQHLSPDFESLMDLLLSKKTDLPIRVIVDGMQLEPGTIYLMPPEKEVVLSGREFQLNDRSSKQDLSFPIDDFFRSLALHVGKQAVAVLLSGAGSDGARGIRSVAEAGGVVIAQSETTAKFDSMPRNACDTGVVDLVTAPAEMPAAIVAYANSPVDVIRAIDQGADVQGRSPVHSILNLLKTRFGVDFSQYKLATIGRRIERRIMLSGSISDVDYIERLQGKNDELDVLYRDLLIGVTGFYRDNEVFERLRKEIIAPLLQRLSAEEEFRVWVVATATGEEAYTYAVLLYELYEELGLKPRFKIFASDIHPESLDIAGRGVYSDEAIGGLSPERRKRFFERRSDGFHASPELRAKIVFVQHDVINNAPFTNLDFISCRNLFIYLNPEAQKKVLSLFHFGLKTGGGLCMGKSERPAELDEEFEVVNEQCRIYRKHRSVRLPSELRMPFSSAPGLIPPSEPPANASNKSLVNRQLIKTYDKLLEQFVASGVLISANQQLLHTFGGATEFLHMPTGRPTNDILDVVLPELRTAVSAVIRRSRPDQAASIVAESPCEGKSSQSLRITASKIGDTSGELLITFSPIVDAAVSAPAEIHLGGMADAEYEVLENELVHTKERLQSTIEEAQTTNEELQSTNEQLTASNEELQSTNEELHSVNEELYTVNAEHQRKIDELVELNDDMDNLLNSTTVHTIFLDRRLKLRRFTPGIRGIFNLIPQDIGRPLDAFTHNILEQDLTEKVNSVIATSCKYEREVHDKQRNFYLLRILPYVTRGQVDGAVVTLVDITSLKQAESKLAELSEIVEHSDDAIFRQDVDGTIRTWNRGAERLFEKRALDILGRHVSTLDLQCKNTSALQMLKLVECGQSLDHVEAVYQKSDQTIVNIALSLSPIRDSSGLVIGASAIARDISKFKQAESKVREAIRRRDEFLAMLSHELRNPFAAVLNATNLLSEAKEGDKVSTVEAKIVIEQNVQHVARILDDLLDISRITNDKLSFSKDVVDLRELVGEVVSSIQHRIDAKQQKLQVITPSSSLFVEGDAARLRQMQVNLLVNASKYTAFGGRIEYRIEIDEDDALIVIRDNGDGISPDLIDSVFEPFVQAQQTIDRAQGGMGLGLALVKKVATAHGGSVSVSSSGLGKGSEFLVRLSTTRSRPQRRNQADLACVLDRKMLVIEDNDAIRSMLVRTLKLKGIDAIDAPCGTDGLKLVQEHSPQVAIIDVGLPDLDGYAVAQKIREMPDQEDVLLVAVTGYGRDRDRETALAAGFDIHLVKPIDPNDLLLAIADANTAVAR